jgi:hypothetical protein
MRDIVRRLQAKVRERKYRLTSHAESALTQRSGLIGGIEGSQADGALLFLQGHSEEAGDPARASVETKSLHFQ